MDWSPKELANNGMPLRFVNNREQCAMMVKLSSIEDIDVKSPQPVKGKGSSLKTRRRCVNSACFANSPSLLAFVDPFVMFLIPPPPFFVKSSS